MQYVFLEDINALKNSKKIVIIYTLCIIAYVLFALHINKQVEVKNINFKALGMVYSDNFLELLIYILNICFYTYMTMCLFTIDIKNGGGNIFTRISKKRYLFYKLASIFILLFTSKVIYHLIINVLCSTTFNPLLLMIDFIYTAIISLIIIIFYIVNNSKFNAFIILLSIYLLISLIKKAFLSAINLPLLPSLFLLVILMLITIYLNRLLFVVYERNG